MTATTRGHAATERLCPFPFSLHRRLAQGETVANSKVVRHLKSARSFDASRRLGGGQYRRVPMNPPCVSARGWSREAFEQRSARVIMRWNLDCTTHCLECGDVGGTTFWNDSKLCSAMSSSELTLRVDGTTTAAVSFKGLVPSVPCVAGRSFSSVVSVLFATAASLLDFRVPASQCNCAAVSNVHTGNTTTWGDGHTICWTRPLSFDGGAVIDVFKHL